MKNDLKIQQRDAYNCGPIACMKVMELLGCMEYHEMMDDTVKNTVAFYRSNVIEKFERLVKRFDEDLHVSIPMSVCEFVDNGNGNDDHSAMDCFCLEHNAKMETIELPCCKKVLHVACMGVHMENGSLCPFCRSLLDRKQLLPHAMVIHHFDESEAPIQDKIKEKFDFEPSTLSVREQTMENKRKHQAQSHERMKRLRHNHIAGADLLPGVVVTIRVGSKFVSHSVGVIGVVADAKDTGGLQVVCASGLINYWVPYGEYAIVAKADEDCPLPDDLKNKRKSILNGLFDIATCENDTAKGSSRSCWCKQSMHKEVTHPQK